MPIYDYKCGGCGEVYDVFHKVREVKEDIVCPKCQSTEHVRLISAPSVSVKGKSSQSEFVPPCGDASCCGGSCSMN
jgi:putative FmdB family regulatory protein